MGKDLYECEEVLKCIFDEVDEMFEIKLSLFIFEGDVEELIFIYNVQFVLLIISIVVLEKFKEFGIILDFIVGYSFGEYLVFVVVGVMIFKDVVYMVRKWGEFMNEVVFVGEGVMVVILGMDVEFLKKVMD